MRLWWNVRSMDSLGPIMDRRSERRRRHAALIALTAALALAACSGDPTPATTPTVGGSASSPSDPTPAGEGTPSATTTGSDTVGPGGELATGVNLCEELDPASLSRITGLRLDAGVFDGAICAWVDRDERGTLTMSLGRAEGSTTAYIREVESLDIGEEVTVAGADDAAAVTITSGAGASRSTRVALVAKVGRDRLTVVLTSRDANLDAVTTIAELVTNA